MTRTYHVTILLLWAVWAAGACAAPGQEQNYQDLEGKEQDPFQTEKDPFFGGEPASFTAAVPANTATETIQDQPFPPCTPGSAPGLSPRSSPGPSLMGLDRSHWPTVVGFSPADGRTPHNPTYFGDIDLHDDAVDLRLALNVPTRMEQALSGHRAENLSIQNLAESVFATARFGAHVLLLPVSAVIEPPLSTTTAP